MTDEKDFLNPDEIDALLNAPPDDSEPSASEEPANSPQNQAPGEENLLDSSEIENLLKQKSGPEGQTGDAEDLDPDPSPEDTLDQAEAQLGAALSDSINMPDPTAVFGSPAPFEMEQFDGSKPPSRTKQPLEILQDVELDLRIELGRTELLIEEVVQLKEGSVVPLDKLAGDPVDILVNGRLIARGEVLVLNDNFCVRVAEILTPQG